ncbi:hypothetical protein B484DRAFT_406576 [Ochromonadaceae sp. CCMP2298]|nr:hypothetical protein B484DRAFT_406576 [Ochromonadaceae sp. CCMP2298]
MPFAPILGCSLTLNALYIKNYRTPMEADGVDDRAYRIMHNTKQTKVDQFSIVGAAVGAAVGAVAVPGLRGILASSATGVVAGLICFGGESHYKQVSAFFGLD